MCSISGEEHPILTVAVVHPDIRTPKRNPCGLAHVNATMTSPPIRDSSEHIERGFAFLIRRNRRLELERVSGGQRAQSEKTFRALPNVPMIAVSTLDMNVSDQHAMGFQSLSKEGNPRQMTNRTFTAVAAHQPPGLDGHRGRPRKPGQDAIFLLCNASQLNSKFNARTELLKLRAQGFLNPPLRDDQWTEEWRSGPRRWLFVQTIVVRRSSKSSSVRGCSPLPLEPVAGPFPASTIRTRIPLCAKAHASVKPVGPAPTTSTSDSAFVIRISGFSGQHDGEDCKPELSPSRRAHPDPGFSTGSSSGGYTCDRHRGLWRDHGRIEKSNVSAALSFQIRDVRAWHHPYALCDRLGRYPTAGRRRIHQ